MRRSVNLARETDNIRNRIRPGKKESSSIIGFTLLGIVILAGMVTWYFYSVSEESSVPIDVGMDESVREDTLPVEKTGTATTPVESFHPAPPSDAVPTPLYQQEADLANEPTAVAQAVHDLGGVKREPVAAAASSNASTLPMGPEPVEELSRPITAPVESMKEQAPPPSASGWHIRFGVFRVRDNAYQLVRDLAKRDIAAHVMESASSLDTTRIVYGPWPTDSQASGAAVRLQREGIATNQFAAGSKRFVSTDPLESEEAINKAESAGLKFGYTSKKTTKKEPLKVYKVFTTKAYGSKDQARTDTTRFTRMKIDNLVEKQR